MESGVLTTLSETENQFKALERYGIHATHLCNWNMNLLRPEIAEKVQRDSCESAVRIVALWAGYSNATEWNSLKGPDCLGLVPPQYREERIRELKRGADFAAMLGTPAIITHCGFIPETPGSPLYKDTLKAIEEVAVYCAEHQLEFWFECGQETPITLLRTIEDLDLPNLGINFDTANLILYGRGNPVDALDIFGKYVRSVHVKDGFNPTDGYHNGKHCPVGHGIVDFKTILSKLIRLNYRGELIIEREIEGEEQARDIMAALQYMSTLLNELEMEGKQSNHA